MNPADYQITFRRDPLMGLWSYEIRTPDDRTLHSLLGVSMSKEHIERRALRHIELDSATETVSGADLAQRMADLDQRREQQQITAEKP